MKTKKNRKIFVLDTSVLVYDATAFKSFQNCDIIIPIIVLEELDKVKKNPNESGKNARVATRYLDEVSHKGEIHLGIEIDNDCSIRIDTEAASSLGSDPTYGDNQILACTKKHQLSAPVDGLVTLISRDINLRIRARANGMLAEDYNNDRGPDLDLYSGVQRIQDEEMGADLISAGELTADTYPIVSELYPNECIIVTADDGRVIALGRKTKNFVKIIRDKDPWGLMGKNPEQQLAIDMLLDPKLPLVSIVGPAGGGKSLVSLACGLELVLTARKYMTFSIYRPIVSMGSDIGYLPGDQTEKLNPHYASIDDGFQFLLSDSINGKNKGKDSWREKLHQYIDNGTITKEALSYIRGRSIINSLILVDECFPHEQNIETENGKKRIGILYDMFIKDKELPKVKTYNEETNQFEFKKIINAWNRGEKKLTRIICGNRKIECTENHPFLTIDGWKKTNELEVGDLIKTTEANSHQILKSLNDDQTQILLGSFLGDGHISCHGLNRYRLKVIHGIKQSDYCQWKSNMFHSEVNYIEKNGYSQTPAIKFVTKMFGLKYNIPNKKTTCPQWILDNLDERGLAIWFMDDGTANVGFNGARLSTCSFDEESQVRIVKKIQSMGIDCEYVYYLVNNKKSNGYFYINFKKNGYRKLSEIIAPYCHNNLAYKIYEFEKNEPYKWNNNFNNYGLTVVDNIEKINKIKEVYDIEIEDNHNFIVCSQSRFNTGGLIAHNCQNLSKEEVKTIVTRVGQGSKIVLTGDPSQIDNPHLDATSNGLSYLIDKFQKSHLSGHITLSKGERSLLATEAAELL